MVRHLIEVIISSLEVGTLNTKFINYGTAFSMKITANDFKLQQIKLLLAE